MKTQEQEVRFQGEPICRGIANGTPFFFARADAVIPEFKVRKKDVEQEIQRYLDAVDRSREDLKNLQKKLLQEHVDEGAAILDAHLEIMHDPLMTSQVETTIRETRKNAESVFQSIMEEYRVKFESLSDPFFQERYKDLQDITRRVIGYLGDNARVSLAEIPKGSVVFARELTASDIAEANTSAVSAIVTERGGSTSHAAIVAKAKGIPYITNVRFEAFDPEGVVSVIVDGRTGDLVVNPSNDSKKLYTNLENQLQSHLQKLSVQSTLPAETYDGYSIQLSANVDMESELEMLHLHGGSGVGLFRSEYLFLANQNFPSEDEQYQIYRNLVKKMKGLPIVIRTFDVGGDKILLEQQASNEVNPFLGCRAIRLLLREQEHFRSQLRAILRASADGEVSILLPMISSLPEVIESKELLEEVKKELKTKGIPFAKKVRIGCMVEVPSAAVIADLLARECDFLSIGTNDLVQYSLAVDRGNHAISGLYSPTDPSVIRLIKLVVTEAERYGIPVTVCGEMAADPRFVQLLLGLGVHELSVVSRSLPIIKHAVRCSSIVEATHLAEEVLKLSHASEIEQLINEAYQRQVPDDCFYNP